MSHASAWYRHESKHISGGTDESKHISASVLVTIAVSVGSSLGRSDSAHWKFPHVTGSFAAVRGCMEALLPARVF